LSKNDETTEILIIGAGPTGLIAAKTAALKGCHVTVLEEHPEVGIPRHCAGLVSVKGLKELDVWPNDAFIQNTVSGATFYSPSGLSFKVEGKEKKAYVIERSSFDKFLAKQAVAVGVDLRLGFQVVSLLFRDNCLVGVSGKSGQKILANVVIDAEGCSGKLLKTHGLMTPDSERLIPAIQFELDNIDLDSNNVELFLGKKVTPDFFAWIIPTGENSARVGLASRKAELSENLLSFMQKHLKKYKISRKYGGFIYTGKPSKMTYNNGLLVVGDAAGQTKPTTGGGVIIGGMCAHLAGKTAAEAVSNEDFSSSFLKIFERRWKKRFLKELRIMYLARKFIDALSDKHLDDLFRIIIEKELYRKIEEYGDFDFQSRVLLRLAFEPSLIKYIPFIIKSFY
jgi:digeranylgeranylglycerophospholipid reductase